MSTTPQTPPDSPFQFACCRVGGPDAGRIVAGSGAATWGLAVAMMHRHPMTRLVTVPKDADLRSNPLVSEMGQGLIEWVVKESAGFRCQESRRQNALLVDRVTLGFLVDAAKEPTGLMVNAKHAMRGIWEIAGMRLIPVDIEAHEGPKAMLAYVMGLEKLA